MSNIISSVQTAIEISFDYIWQKVMEDERKDYLLKALSLAGVKRWSLFEFQTDIVDYLPLTCFFEDTYPSLPYFWEMDGLLSVLKQLLAKH